MALKFMRVYVGGRDSTSFMKWLSQIHNEKNKEQLDIFGVCNIIGAKKLKLTSCAYNWLVIRSY